MNNKIKDVVKRNFNILSEANPLPFSMIFVIKETTVPKLKLDRIQKEIADNSVEIVVTMAQVKDDYFLCLNFITM